MICNKSREQREYLINLAIQEYLDTPETQRSLTKLGEKYGVKRQTISKYLKQRGFEVINYQNRSRLNEHVFDVMCSEEQFYWLGFLYADGNISSTGNRVEVRLSLKDLSHLEKFRKFLNLTSEIRTGICDEHGFCHLSVRNKHLWQTLNDLGCTPRKSLTLKFPNLSIFPSKVSILHFLRGYVDGDGCLSIYLNQKKTSYRTMVSIVGTKSFLSTVNALFGNKGNIMSKTSKNWENNAFQLSFSDVPSRKFARYLYQNATIYLDRKYDKYLKFCRIEEESSRRKSSKIGEGCDANPEVSPETAKGLGTPQSVESE